MFGTKLRTWMETHIVRSRKKQQRNKEDKKADSCSKIIVSVPSCHIESNSFERQYGKKSPRNSGNAEVLAPQSSNISLPSKTSMSFDQSNNGHCAVNNLSSPESAYSTGYSTDGTSPGASIPPEYYINIRTGTHYFHSNPASVTNPNEPLSQSETTNKVGSINPPPSEISQKVLSPRPSRHKREDEAKKKIRHYCDVLPESSTEEDIAERLGKVNVCSLQPMATPKTKSKLPHQAMNSNLHRRTESYDERHHHSFIEAPDSGDSYQCTSPYLPGASPRQRNRIRTNPWLGTNHLANGNKAYNSQGETSSTVGSSSTLSSSGCKQTSDDNTLSPRSKERRRLVREHCRDMKNCNAVQQSSAIFSPVLKSKKHLNTVTTCSPQPNRSCHHALRPRSPASSSSPSSAQSSASDDDHHGNTSDFSDDDVTLNEMLGKFDESYVYEKETDILSDSDPTDCEEQAEEEDKTDNGNLPESGRHEDFDFIDNGSMVELALSDSECSSKAQGHCTYHQPSCQPLDETCKLTPRLRESISRRQSASRRDRQSRKGSRNKGNGSRKKLDSPSLSTHKINGSYGTYVKSSSQSLDSGNSFESITKTANIGQSQNRRAKRVDSVPRPGDNPGKYVNLNRVLMERLINNQRNGTRSADGTPISLRKRGVQSKYNGKYIKNHYVSNLISSDANFNERRSSLEENHTRPGTPDNVARSNSLSLHSHPSIKPRTPSSVGCGLNHLDKEGDLKYRQLIQEAENIIEDLQVKSKSPQYLSPTFRCRNGMERAKPSSPLVFSVPPSPLSLRYDVYRDSCERITKEQEQSNNNSVFEQPLYTLQKEKNTENEESLLKTISKTLERIIIGGTSDTNRKLDKSVADPFAKNKKKYVLAPNVPIYSNVVVNKVGENQSGNHSGFATPNLLRRSSTGNAPFKLSTVNSGSKLNQNELGNTSGLRRFFRRSDKHKTSSFDEHLDRHNFPENGFCINTGFSKPANDYVYENGDVYKMKQDVQNASYQETRSPILDYSPNGNTPYLNGFQQIPWQHRTSQAERLKHLSDLRNSPKRKTDSPELTVEQKPSLVSFRSVDLGNKNTVGSGYCPQSEPVKRKVYTCSATFEKLQKTLLRKQPEIYPCKEMPNETEPLETNEVKVKCRVAQLKRGRFQVHDTQDQINRLMLPSDIVNG